MKRVLWAKGRPIGSTWTPPTVEGHCRFVRAAAEAVWTHVEPDLARALALDSTELRRVIWPLYLTATLLHDIAKANSAFQAMVQKTPRTWKRQPVRHEVLAATLANHRGLWGTWLVSALGEKDFWTVILAVAGHHLEVREPLPGEREDPLYRTGETPRELTVFLDDEQVGNLLAEVVDVLKEAGRAVEPPPPGRLEKFETDPDEPRGLKPLVRDLERDARRVWDRLQGDSVFKRNVALLKALLIAADVAGSALPADGQEIGPWVRRVLDTRLTADDMEQVIADSLEGRPPRDFQEKVAASHALATVVTAGCGNGKTTAAYMWARRHAVGRKLFFTYPTTGTASAGFKDYLSVQRHLERALIHGRAWVDLQAMPASPGDSPAELAQRLESLQAWGQHVIACTADTVLGLMQNQRRPLFSFPAIVSGAIVFDEVHSYDHKMFGSLLRFLETFPGIPVLLMSATIPPARLEALKRILGNRMNIDNAGTSQPIFGDRRLERVKRYRIENRDSIEACWNDVARAIEADKKVLWVCNTVNDAIRIFRETCRRFPQSQRILYHSRFWYRHRVKRQDDVVDEFAYREEEGRRHERGRPRAALVVSTQVCEMSLDLSADLLVSAWCPLPSLVQRLGRLNRYARADDPWPCVVYPFKIGRKPYDKDDQVEQVRDAAATIHDLDGRPCSQEELAERIRKSQNHEDWSEQSNSAWLDGGWYSRSLPLRDSDNSITLIREEDLPEVERELGPEDRRVWTAKTLVPWTIPMLLPKNGFTFARRVGGYPVAAAGTVKYESEYSKSEGAEWATQTKL